jgi:hypothetical protein
MNNTIYFIADLGHVDFTKNLTLTLFLTYVKKNTVRNEINPKKKRDRSMKKFFYTILYVN